MPRRLPPRAVHLCVRLTDDGKSCKAQTQTAPAAPRGATGRCVLPTPVWTFAEHAATSRCSHQSGNVMIRPVPSIAVARRPAPTATCRRALLSLPRARRH
eukprot:1572746-Prymnesium_polylepis.1